MSPNDLPPNPASTAVVASLEDDPFYRRITAHLRDETRRARLAAYFSCTNEEGRAIGRSVQRLVVFSATDTLPDAIGGYQALRRYAA